MQNLQYFLLIQEKFYKKKVNVVVDGELINNTFKPYQFEVLKTIVPKDNSMNKQIGVYLTFEADPTLGPKSEIGSVNGLEVNQGQHITIAETLFKTALKDYFKVKHDYLLNGLQMCVIILAGETVFDSQTKTRLKQISKVKPTDCTDIVKEIEKVFRKNQDYWELHVHKLNQLAESMKSIGAIEKAQKIIDSSNGISLYRSKANMIDGFWDATAGPGDRWNCELFMTEGLSPGGSLKAARKANDVKYCAVLSLRGKVLDTSDCNADKMMDNKEFYTMFSAIGLGISVKSVISDATSAEEAYELIKKKSRFGKIVIATDKTKVCV